MEKLLQECPVCSSTLQVKVVQCPACQTRIEGNFEPPHSKILYLAPKDLEFVEHFLRVRGNIKEMEKVLGVSYPTVRGMLDAINGRMGFPTRQQVDPAKRMKIISQLEKGEITAEKAVELLKTQDSEQ